MKTNYKASTWNFQHSLHLSRQSKTEDKFLTQFSHINHNYTILANTYLKTAFWMSIKNKGNESLQLLPLSHSAVPQAFHGAACIYTFKWPAINKTDHELLCIIEYNNKKLINQGFNSIDKNQPNIVHKPSSISPIQRQIQKKHFYPENFPAKLRISW